MKPKKNSGRRLWGFGLRVALGFSIVIVVTILTFSQILIGRIEGYLLHDMENSMANLAVTAKSGIEIAANTFGAEGIAGLGEASISTFQLLVKDIAGKIGCRIVITDRKGLEMIDSRGPSYRGFGIMGEEEITEAFDTGYGASTRIDNVSGLYTMYVAYPIESIGGGTVGVIRLSKPTDSITGLLHSIRYGILVSGLLAGGVAALISILLTVGLARPVNKIRSASIRFGEGELDARSSVKGRSDLAELSHAFDRMADRIERTFNEISEIDSMKSDFVANVSHELKTPLSAIKGLAETLLDGAIDDDEVSRKFLLDILSESERLLLMVNNVLNISKIEAGVLDFNKEELDIGAIIDGVVSRMGPVLERKGVEAELVTEGETRLITGDGSMIDQAIANVVDNAVKYTKPGTAIKISCGLESHRGFTDIVVKVLDNGPGVPENEKERIFERFHRSGSTQSGRKGSGLGLAIARGNIEAHNGTIGLANAPEGGVLVTIRIPLSPDS
ncbi:MAG: HAMP domain-containing protein [Actinobacteria bacterium]|nr:HAMP domain-containing protein [Actinomycetota bacterium]